MLDSELVICARRAGKRGRRVPVVGGETEGEDREEREESAAEVVQRRGAARRPPQQPPARPSEREGWGKRERERVHGSARHGQSRASRTQAGGIKGTGRGEGGGGEGGSSSARPAHARQSRSVSRLCACMSVCLVLSGARSGAPSRACLLAWGSLHGPVTLPSFSQGNDIALPFPSTHRGVAQGARTDTRTAARTPARPRARHGRCAYTYFGSAPYRVVYETRTRTRIYIEREREGGVGVGVRGFGGKEERPRGTRGGGIQAKRKGWREGARAAEHRTLTSSKPSRPPWSPYRRCPPSCSRP